MTKGEELKVLVHYDLLGNDVYHETGTYVSTNESTGKLLIYFSKYGEWGELSLESVERVNPDDVSPKSLEFISRIKKLNYTLMSIAC